MKQRIAVLASGGGSNYEALASHLELLGDDAPGEIVVVLSDRRAAGALARAESRSTRAQWLAPESRDQLLSILHEHQVDVVVLAGYLKLIPSDVARAYAGKLVNVHPALLPAFGGPGMYGHRIHDAVLARGARVTGVTVHFVDEAYDHGPIIAQWPVPVRPGDDAATLGARVLQCEHVLYPRVVASVCAGGTRLLDDGRVVTDVGARSDHFLQVEPDGSVRGCGGAPPPGS